MREWGGGVEKKYIYEFLKEGGVIWKGGIDCFGLIWIRIYVFE